MSPILTGVIASGISGNLTPAWSPEGGYDALASVLVPSGGTTSVTFSGIPSGYKHLELRSTCVVGADLNIRFNGDSSSTYPYHYTYGAGSTPVSTADSVYTYGYVGYGGFGGATSVMSAITSIQDYSSTTKFKTTRSITGNDGNTTGGGVMFTSTLWRSTQPINSITLYSKDAATFAQNSSFALYGVK